VGYFETLFQLRESIWRRNGYTDTDEEHVLGKKLSDFKKDNPTVNKTGNEDK
jgi:hypothetical protein